MRPAQNKYTKILLLRRKLLLDREEGLRSVTTRGWLSETSYEFQRALLSGCDLRRFEAGAPLQVGGEERGELIGLAQGILALRTTLGPADTAMMHLAHPVSWLGCVPALFNKPQRIAASARTLAWVVRISEKTIKRTLSEHPQWCAHFLQLLLNYGDVNAAMASDLMIRDAERRCTAALLRLAGCRFASPQDAGAVEAAVTQDELAGAANLSRNSVGVMLRRLQRRGLIRVEYGRMIVLAPRVLRAFVDQG
jgi:CRP/FNR family cyclic AMP-dependent transcriptional regulator